VADDQIFEKFKRQRERTDIITNTGIAGYERDEAAPVLCSPMLTKSEDEKSNRKTPVTVNVPLQE
jgi:hypothetical protein